MEEGKEKGEGDEEKVAELGHVVVEVQFGCGLNLEKVLLLHVVPDDQHEEEEK